MRDGLSSLQERGLEHGEIVIATSQPVSATRQTRLEAIAQAAAARLLPVYARSWVAGQLYWHPEWRKRLIGIEGDPSALVRRPLELSAGLGGRLSLRGRDIELDWLRKRLGQDVLVEGVPGIGKTRLLAELGDGVLFLEEGPLDRLSDDLRYARPAAVVVDRVEALEDQIRGLRRIRDEENGLDFGIIMTVWPDQTSRAAELLPSNIGTLRLSLLERGDIHQILEEVGVPGYFIRREILRQAEGRAGWAIALAEVARAGRVTEVLAGEAAHRAAVQYLAGIGEGEEAQGVLACLALLDGLPDAQLGRLAKTLGMSQRRLAELIEGSSRRGLMTKNYRGWCVGPEALRYALVARWFFGSPPREDYGRVVSEWPDFQEHALTTIIGAAESGSVAARQQADSQIRELVGEYEKAGLVPPAALLEAYARLDPAAATWAVNQAGPEIERSASTPAPRRSSYAELLAIAVGRFQIPRAVHLILDLAVGDERGVGQTPDHPLRIIDDVASRIIPDIGFRFGERVAVADAACSWIDQDPTMARWKVFAHVAGEVLGPDVEGHHQDLADPLKIVITTGLAPPAAMQQIVDRIWPALRDRLIVAPDETVASVLDSFSNWARAAWMTTGASGAPVPDDRRETAFVCVERFLSDLEARCAMSPGLSLRFNDMSLRARFDRQLPIDPELQILSLGGLVADRKQAWERNEQRLRELAQQWANEPPEQVIERLVRRREALMLTGNLGQWIGRALWELGKLVVDPDMWCAEAVRQGLGAESYGLMVAALERAK